jgi:hypothetical protein
MAWADMTGTHGLQRPVARYVPAHIRRRASSSHESIERPAVQSAHLNLSGGYLVARFGEGGRPDARRRGGQFVAADPRVQQGAVGAAPQRRCAATSR